MSKSKTNRLAASRVGAVFGSLGLVGALGALGCGGGDDEEPSTGLGGLFGGSQGDGTVDVCRDSAIGDFPPRPVEPTGTAHFTPNPVSEDETELDLVEITCEASRDAEGRVVGFFASFYTEWDEGFLVDFASVSWSGQFNGPGQYDNATLVYAYDDSFSDSRVPGTLVLEADGLTGRFSATRAELTFSCGNASKLSLETIPWPPLPLGTARVVSNAGVMYEFPGITCGTSNGEFGISTLNSPFQLRMNANGTGTGSHSIEDTSTDYAGTYKGSASTGGTMTINCGATPVTGTINERGTFACQR